MHTFAKLIVLAIAFGLWGQAHAEEIRAEKEDPKLTQAWKELDGRWKQVGVTSAHGGYGDTSDYGREIEISRDGVAIYRFGKLVREKSRGGYEIDPSQKPAHLNMFSRLMGVSNYSSRLFIYRIQDDELQIEERGKGVIVLFRQMKSPPCRFGVFR